MKMSGLYAQSDLPLSRYVELAKKLYAPLLLGDNSVLLFYPMNGTDYDVINMWDREEDRALVLGNQRNRFEFANLTLANPDTIGENIWIEQLQHALKIDVFEKMSFVKFSDTLKDFVREGKEPVFFVNIPDSFSDERLRAFFDLATRIHFISRHRIHFLLTFDMRWNRQEFLLLTKEYNTLFEHVHYVPAATTDEVTHFVNHFCIEWNYPLSQKAKELLVEEAGGSLVLPKYALRLIIRERLAKVSDIRAVLRIHPDYVRLVRMFLSRLTPLQQDILQSVANHKKVPDEEEAQHMVTLDIIRRLNTSYEIRSPSIVRYLQSDLMMPDIRETIQGSDIFSKREKTVLLKLYDASGQPVAKEELAHVIWGDDAIEKYSDWSLDQVISRIRKKMTHVPYLNGKTIISVKRKGFQFLA